jgi:hypothetical protein
VPAGEIGLYRDAAIGPRVREPDGSAGRRHHRSGTDDDLEAIAHQPILPQPTCPGPGRPVPGGGGIAFTARLGTEDFGSSAARILASGVITAP